jgi:hypothetical protein
MFRRLTAENLTQDHEFSAVKTASAFPYLRIATIAIGEPQDALVFLEYRDAMV